MADDPPEVSAVVWTPKTDEALRRFAEQMADASHRLRADLTRQVIRNNVRAAWMRAVASAGVLLTIYALGVATGVSAVRWILP